MKNYRVQSGCWNCEHAFRYYEYDEDNVFYCKTVRPGERPPCGSVAMEEEHDWQDMTKRDKEQDVWDTWAEDRYVAVHGKCDEWQEKEVAE